MKRKYIVLLILGVLLSSCEEEPLHHTPQDETNTPARSLRSDSSGTYYMNVQGLIRNPDGSGGEYIEFPYLDITELENTASLKRFSLEFDVPDGEVYNDDTSKITNYVKGMADLMGPEIEFEPGQVRFTYESELREEVIPEEFFNTIDSLQIFVPPFSNGTDTMSLAENIQHYENSEDVEINESEDEIILIYEMGSIHTESGNVLKAYITIDKATNEPLHTEIKDGEELVMSFEFSNEYNDPRDVTISKFMDGLEIMKITFSNTEE